MRQITMPRRIETKKGSKGGSELGTALGLLAGATIGGLAAGPMGAAEGAKVGAGAIAGGALTGAATGSGLGGLIGGMADKGKQDQVVDKTVQPVQGSAMQRRGTGIDHAQAIKEGIYALQNAPPDIANQYVMPLAEAYKKARG